MIALVCFASSTLAGGATMALPEEGAGEDLAFGLCMVLIVVGIACAVLGI